MCAKIIQNNMTSNNDNNNYNNEDGGEEIIDHDRLRSISNYYFESMVGLPVHARAMRAARLADSSCAEELREEARQERYKMVSWMEDDDLLEEAGLNLDWGEYYIADDEMESDEQSDVSLFEEAEEINDEEVDRECEKAAAAVLGSKQISAAVANFDQLDIDAVPSNPSLMGMPDTILEKILHYTKYPSEICTLESVCKRIRRMTTCDEFWARHSIGMKYLLYTIVTNREDALRADGLRQIRRYQKNSSNAIIDVLGDGSECVADILRTLSADILARMNHLGPAVHFRLRGDTLGYLFEILQGYMIKRLEIALLLAINTVTSRLDQNLAKTFVVDKEDMALAFQTDSFQSPVSSYLPYPRPVRCKIAEGSHGQILSTVGCSCSISSSSGLVWRWPLDDCHDVLPPEAGRRIIRRLAYQAGIREMSNEAFIVAEAELLHALGMLLVDVYESSVEIEMTRKSSFLSTDEELTYNEPTKTVDMFKSPPPPFYPLYKPLQEEDEQDESIIYTIVPGQVRSAAEKRDITPCIVYGDVWIATSGFTAEEEMGIERSYYYDEYCEYEPDISDNIKLYGGFDYHDEISEEKVNADDGNDSEISWDESEDEDSEMDMDDYSEMGGSIEPYYSSDSLQDEDEDVVDLGMEIDNNIEEFMA